MPSPARNVCIGAVSVLPAQKKKPSSRRCTDWSANCYYSVVSRRCAALQIQPKLSEPAKRNRTKKAARMDRLLEDGVADGDRTRDHRNHNPVLYQLSYSHHCITCCLLRQNWMARPAGFEPATYGLEGRCSIQLSYGRSTSSLQQFPKMRVVGEEGFEPPTSCSQSRRATRLRYSPLSH